MRKLLLLTAMSLSAAWADQNAPSDALFGRLIQQALSKQAQLCKDFPIYSIPVMDAPHYSVIAPEEQTADGRRFLAALARRGYLKYTVSTRDTTDPRGMIDPAGSTFIDLTEKGKAWIDDHGQVCYARAVFGKVVHYSVPSSLLGTTVTRITYTYTLTDIPDWARDKAIQTGLKLHLPSGPQEAQVSAALMSDGWKLDRRLQIP